MNMICIFKLVLSRVHVNVPGCIWANYSNLFLPKLIVQKGKKKNSLPTSPIQVQELCPEPKKSLLLQDQPGPDFFRRNSKIPMPSEKPRRYAVYISNTSPRLRCLGALKKKLHPAGQQMGKTPSVIGQNDELHPYDPGIVYLPTFGYMLLIFYSTCDVNVQVKCPYMDPMGYMNLQQHLHTKITSNKKKTCFFPHPASQKSPSTTWAVIKTLLMQFYIGNFALLLYRDYNTPL